MAIKNDDGAERLMQGIVKQDIYDYRCALNNIPELEKQLEEYQDAYVQKKLWSAINRKEECERFFKSEWCYFFTGIDSDVLMKNIHKKIKDNEGKTHGKGR